MKSPNRTWMLRNALCAIALAGAITTQAQTTAPEPSDEPTATITDVHLQQIVANQSKFRLQFANPASERVILTITDAQGNTLLQRKLVQAKFTQNFDLSTLQDGTYTFTLASGKQVIKREVQLNTDYVVVKKAYIK